MPGPEKSLLEKLQENAQAFLTNVQNLNAGKAAGNVRGMGSDLFDSFELATGTRLPGADPRARELQERIDAKKKELEAALKVSKERTESQKAKVNKLVEEYETECKKLVTVHEDAMQFKFLADDIVKEIRAQRSQVEAFSGEEVKQYTFQAKDFAAQLAMASVLAHKIQAGQPFKDDLQSLFSCVKLSHLAHETQDPNSPPPTSILTPAMVHKNIKDYCAKGIPNVQLLHKKMEDLYPKASALEWTIPNAGLPGRLWTNVAEKVTSPSMESSDLFAVKEYLAYGETVQARDRLQHWLGENATMRKDPHNEHRATLDAVRDFSRDVDLHLRGKELNRYLGAKLLAQEKALLQQN